MKYEQYNQPAWISLIRSLRGKSLAVTILFLIGLIVLPCGSGVLAQSPQDVTLRYTLDRGAVPALTYNDLTLKIFIGAAQSVTALVDNKPATVSYSAQSGYALITTGGSNIELKVTQVVPTPRMGYYQKTVLKYDQKWAWSHGFDDNVDFKLHGIPAFDSYGWRATVYLIGSKLSSTRSESWIVDRADIIALVKKGWAIGNHTWSHMGVDAVGGPSAATQDILKLDAYLRQAVNDAGLPNYRLMSFAAPFFDTAYDPIFLSLRNKGTTGLLFNDSGNNFFLRLDPGAVEPDYSRFGIFDFEIPVGRDFRIEHFGSGNEYDLGLRSDIAAMIGQLDENHHYWLNTFNHDVDTKYPTTSIFAFLPWLHNTYGPGGDNSVWVAPAEEIYSYQLVRQKVKITYSGPGKPNFPYEVWIPVLRRP